MIEKVTLGPRPLVYPMPAFLVGAIVDGKPTFMAVAWGGIANSNPPMLTVALQHHRHTNKGIRVGGAFSVNIPSTEHVTEADYCGIVSGKNADKNAACGFKIFYGKLETAPLIEQFPVGLECKVAHILNLGSHALIIGEIIETHVSAACMSEGKPDITKIKPFTYCEGAVPEYRSIGDVIAPAFNVGRKLKT